MILKENCCCGAELYIETIDPDLLEERHEAFLEAHSVCRVNQKKRSRKSQ